MRNLIALLAIILCCSEVQAQNVEGQIVASQFGTFQVPGLQTGSLQFSPASCQVTGGGKNFEAFSAGTPLKVVDSNPALTEVATPASVQIGACSVSMATTYLHATPFYVTSGTGGLQEALTNGPNKQGGPNTVILNADWYTQVAPSNPATVIAAVKGSTKLGLVDVTTVPYTVYAWNGSAYAVIPYGGGGASFPGTNGIVFNTTPAASRNATASDIVTLLGTTAIGGAAANLYGTPTLPAGTQATTGTVGQNDNLLATNAQVYASKNASIPVTSLVLCGNAIAGQSKACAPNVDYLTPTYWAALTGCTTPGTVYSPQSNTCVSSTASPAGSTTQVQSNQAGSFSGDSTFTFNSSTKTLAAQNLTVSGSCTGCFVLPTAPASNNALISTGAGTTYAPTVIPISFNANFDQYIQQLTSYTEWSSLSRN